ncbi:MAG TPA: hypothetical protein VFQ39_16595, partial [Longimicrobium sp.]|nr:hypothetical protein [Longimicrobium sp.]
VVLLAGALAACDGASKAQGGDSRNQGAGGSPETGQGTSINDTTPHRPGGPDPGAVVPADTQR